MLHARPGIHGEAPHPHDITQGPVLLDSGLLSGLQAHQVLPGEGHVPCLSRQLRLSTDASDIGVGAVLKQMTDDDWWPLECWSRKLTPTEQAYSRFDRELLGVYLSIRHFHHLLSGHVFHILSDHRPLSQARLRKGEPWFPRQTRHLAYITEFANDIRYIAGEHNTI